MLEDDTGDEEVGRNETMIGNLDRICQFLLSWKSLTVLEPTVFGPTDDAHKNDQT